LKSIRILAGAGVGYVNVVALADDKVNFRRRVSDTR
jgi:hypothetical protein